MLKVQILVFYISSHLNGKKEKYQAWFYRSANSVTWKVKVRRLQVKGCLGYLGSSRLVWTT